MKNFIYNYIILAAAMLMPVLALGQSSSLNYISTRVPRAALQPWQLDAAATNKTQVQTTIQYIDGLGRPLQTIQQQGSPTGTDIIQPFAYDALGREAQKYLPYTQAGATAAQYHSNALVNEQAGFYNPAGNGVAFDNSPYAVTGFEASPLNRVSQQGAPGDAWQPAAGHTIKTFYVTNNAPTVNSGSGYWARQYGVSIDAYGHRTLVDQGAYAANSLNVTVTTNENWTSGKPNTTEEYKDYENHVVLRRTFNGTDILSTYYVYDDFGNLAFVLPPKAGADNGAPAAATLNALCYQYGYDERKRLNQKHLPGKEWEYTVYNQLDQPVLTQDGNQRSNNQWTVTKYDALGRVIVTGLWNAGQAIDLGTLQSSIYSSVQYDSWDFTANAGTYPTGYVLNSYPGLSNYLIINYYDGFTAPYQPAGYAPGGGSSAKIRGLLTASSTYILNDPGAALWQVTYYDEEARPRQVYNQHYLGGLSNYAATNYDVTINSYNFNGQPTLSVRSHYKNSSGAAVLALTATTRWTYDHLGRKLLSTEKINGSDSVIVASNTYNEIGQLWQKNCTGVLWAAATPLLTLPWAVQMHTAAARKRFLHRAALP